MIERRLKVKTKEEVIKEAWGKMGLIPKYDCDYNQENGWSSFSPDFKKHPNYDHNNLDFIGIKVCRPKSLQGIENNKGWFKIESENDYPKPGQYWVIDEDGDQFITDMEIFEEIFDWSGIKYYQPIIKPKPPLY